MTRPLSLSPHFSWTEVEGSATAVRLGIDNTLPYALLSNAGRMAQMMECVRYLIGDAFLVGSWYRCAELNKAVGSSSASAHLKALAVDGRPDKLPLIEAFDILRRSGLPFDQLLIESTASGSEWLHIGLSEGPPRRQVLRAHGEKLGGPMVFQRVAAG